MTTKERLAKKTMKDMLETLSGVEKYVLVEKIVDLQQRIDKAIKLLKEAGCYDEKAQIFCDDVWDELPELLNILKGDE